MLPFPMPEGGAGNPFLQMLMHALTASQQKGDDAFDELGPLSESDKAEWKAVREEHSMLVNQAKELEGKSNMLDGRRKVFWAKLENDTGIFDKNMRITDDYRLLIEKDEPKRIPGMLQEPESRPDDHEDEDGWK